MKKLFFLFYMAIGVCVSGLAHGDLNWDLTLKMPLGVTDGYQVFQNGKLVKSFRFKGQGISVNNRNFVTVPGNEWVDADDYVLGQSISQGLLDLSSPYCFLILEKSLEDGFDDSVSPNHKVEVSGWGTTSKGTSFSNPKPPFGKLIILREYLDRNNAISPTRSGKLVCYSIEKVVNDDDFMAIVGSDKIDIK